MEAVKTFEALDAEWGRVEPSPADNGRVELIVRRPAAEQREELSRARFSAAEGLEGDDWLSRARGKSSAMEPSPDTQVTLMSSRVIQLLTGDRSRWAESGDQLFVDLDISLDNLPVGARLQVGGAVLEISATPHTGCGKFARRFGAPARKWVMTEAGKRLRLRGVYASVARDGDIRVGDSIVKI